MLINNTVSLRASLKSLLSVVIICNVFFCFTSCKVRDAHPDAYYDTICINAQRGDVQNFSKSAEEYIDSVIKNTSSPSPYAQYKRYEFKSAVFYRVNKFDSASGYLDSSIVLFRKTDLKDKYPLLYGKVLNERGDYYFLENDMGNAFRCYSQSKLAQIRYKADSCLMSDLSYHLGMVCFRQEKYLTAAAYFKLSLQEISHCTEDSGTYYREQEECSNIALAYAHLRMADSAICFYKKALTLIYTKGAKYNNSERFKRFSDIAEGVVFGNMAKVYIDEGKNDTAEQLLLRSSQINSRPGYEVRDAMFVHIQLAELYYNSRMYGKVLPILNNLRIALDTISNPSVELRWNYLKYRYNKDLNQLSEAISYLEKYYNLKDAADVKDNNLKKVDYPLQLKEAATKYEIELLKKDNQLNKLYLVITVGLSFVALVIIGFIYYSYRRSRKNVMLLTSLNMQVTEQKAMLEQAMVQLSESNEDKDRILRIVAHDLRTPINGIMMISDFVLQEENDVEKRKSLEMIIRSAKNLVHLTNELMEFSGNVKQVDTGEKVLVDLNELARQVVTLLKFKADEKLQRIELFEADIAAMIIVHEEKILRLLSNLITNAIKFSKVGALIKVFVAVTKEHIHIRVQDNGIGIASDQLPYIFDSFTKVQRNGTSGELSYGLGLSICKQIITTHNGKIWVESKEGEGSVFYVELPL